MTQFLERKLGNLKGHIVTGRGRVSFESSMNELDFQIVPECGRRSREGLNGQARQLEVPLDTLVKKVFHVVS